MARRKQEQPEAPEEQASEEQPEAPEEQASEEQPEAPEEQASEACQAKSGTVEQQNPNRNA